MEGGFGGTVEGVMMGENAGGVTKPKKTGGGGKKKNEEAQAADSILAKLTLKHTFGCNPVPMDSIISYNSLTGDRDVNDRLIFKVGKQLCVYDPDTMKQFYLTGRSRNVTNVIHFAVSTSCRYLSVCESVRKMKGGPGHAQASVYTLSTFSPLARQKTVTHNCTGEFICSAFTGDAKYLVTLNDGSDYQLIVWQWDKERIHKSVSLQSKPTKMCVSPSLLQISVSGPGILKCYSVSSDGQLRTSSLLNPSKEAETFLDHKWLPLTDGTYRMVAISNSESYLDGYRRQSIYIFEGLEAPQGTVGPPINLEFRQTVYPRFETPSGSVDGIATFSKGFAVFGKEGVVTIYEKCDDKREPYYEVRCMCLGTTNFVGGAILPSEDKMILASSDGRLVSCSIGQHDIPGEKESENMDAGDLIPGGFHSSAIISADVAFHRSVCATVSLDGTARVWNYDTCKCELVHKFPQEDPLALAIHPSGFQLIVSFKDKVRLYNIYMDRLHQLQETASKSLKELKFSYSGQYWAAASTINVIVFDTKTFNQIMCFQGHMMTVRRVCWGPGDSVLFSAGADGNVYGWSMTHDHRIDVVASSSRSAGGILGIAVDGSDESYVGSNIEKRLNRAVVPWGGDGNSLPEPNGYHIGTNTVVIASQDMSLRLVEWIPLGQDGKPQSRDDSAGKMINLSVDEFACVTCLLISNCKKFLYTGMSDGCLRVYEWPLKQNNPPFIESQSHLSAIVDLRESPTGNVLVTVGEDAAVFVHNIMKGQLATLSAGDGLEMFSASPDTGGFAFNAGVIQMAKEDMDDHIQEVFDLKKRIEEMATKYTFEMHQSENMHADELKRIMDKHHAAMNNEKEKFENMQAKMEAKIRDLNATLESKGLDHVRMTAELENRYEHKLADQLDRYDRLGEEMELLRQRCDGLLSAERAEFERQLIEIKNKSKRLEKKMANDKKRLVDEKNSDENAFKEILDQQEDEYEDELRQLIAAAESELKSERENITKLRTLVQTKNTKLDQLKKKLTELANAAKTRQAVLVHERKERQKLQDTIEHYKKNLLEREEALAEKEKTILELRSTTRTLENFRFVLDHRLQQLSAERGPITQHIEGLEQHIRTMYEELVEEFEIKREESMKAETKDLRIASFTHEVSLLRQDNRQKDIFIATFRRELENVVGAFGQKELEAAVKQLYRKYVKGENIKMDIRPGGATAPKEGSMVQYLLGQDDSDDDSDIGGFSVEGGGTLRGTGGGGVGRSKNVKKAIIQEIETELIDSAKESHRQRQFVERSAENLKHRLRTTKTEAARINRTRLNENSHLIFECNELRKEVKQLQRKLDIANQIILDNQSGKPTQQERSIGAGSTPAHVAGWEFEPQADDNASDVTGNMRKAAAASMRQTDTGGMDSRRSSAQNTGRGLQHSAQGRNAISAVELGANRPHSSSGAKALAHQQSAPNGFSARDELDLAVAGSHTVSRPCTEEPVATGALVGGPEVVADPIPHDYFQGAMTVEQRMLRKKEVQISKLITEVEALTRQLDDATRERSMQRTELSRLRGMLAQSLAASPSPSNAANVSLPKHGRTPKKSGRLLLSVGMDNGVRLNTGTTNADMFGRPSDQDIRDMGAYGSQTGSVSSKGGEGSVGTNGSGSGRQLRLPLGLDKNKTAPAR